MIPGTKAQRFVRRRVLSFVREKGEVSRGEIAHAFSMDKKAVSVAVESLRAEGLLAVSGLRESRAGRRSETLAVNGGHALTLGIDLGATHVIGILADLAGTVLERASYEIRPGLPVGLILDQMRAIAARLLAARQSPAVRAAGVCVPGFVHPAEGISVVAENIPGWRDVRIRELLEQELGLPVCVEDASRALAAAERWLGKARGVSDFMVLDLGYGIGMGMYCEGRIYRGGSWKSGEIGHTVVDPNGLSCACGGRGCLETVASGRALARQAASGITAGKSALLRDLTKGAPDAVTAQDVAVAAGMQDSFAISLLADAGSAVGLALANAAAILNPSLVLLGGGLASAGDVYLEAVKSSVAAHLMPGMLNDMRILVSDLGVDGSARGIALMAAEAIFAGDPGAAASPSGQRGSRIPRT
jgi:predicted NBD/HSP70 family sugar kinase